MSFNMHPVGVDPYCKVDAVCPHCARRHRNIPPALVTIGLSVLVILAGLSWLAYTRQPTDPPAESPKIGEPQDAGELATRESPYSAPHP
jgi:hypothetical protein